MRKRAVQGRCPRPGVPRIHVDGEQHVLVAEALHLAVRRHTHEEPAIAPELVRLPVQGSPGRGEMAQNGRGRPPFADDRRALPDVMVSLGTPHFYTARTHNVARILTRIILRTIIIAK